jgi:signal transduction histidine kinase
MRPSQFGLYHSRCIRFSFPRLSVPVSSVSSEPDPRADRALHRIATIVGRTADPREALRAILAAAAETFAAGSGSIALLSPDTGRLEIEVHQGLPLDADPVALRLGQGITGWVAFHGRPQLVPDVTADPRYVQVRADVRSEMAAPILGPGGQVLGVINLDSDILHGFTAQDLALHVRLTDEASAVMQCLWQLRHLGGKARQLETLIAIGQSLVTKLAPQELFETITREARQILHVRACACYLRDPARDTVRLTALAGLDQASASGPQPSAFSPSAFSTAHRTPLFSSDLPLDSCLVATVIHTRKQVEFSNVQSPEFLDLIDLPRDPALRSLLAAPMLAGTEVIGVLAVFTDHIHRFNNDEKRLLGALASLGAVALQNARLYARVFQSEQSLRKNEQLTTLGLLAAEIAHEIRNPLTVIKLLFGYLQLDFPEGDPRRTDVRLIGEKLDQLEAIVTRVLQFGKAPSSLHSRWSVAEIVDDTILLIRLKLAQAKVRLVFTPPPRALLVDAHKGQLQQVLLNLLLNSTQAMPDGGTITITVSAGEHEGLPQVIVDVADTGTGIPENIRDRIFDSFLSGRPDGTGLGLAIAKRILASHHGDLSLLATSPAGTTLRLRLPLAKP